MATAEVVPLPKVELAQQLEPGVQTLQDRDPVLPLQEGRLLTSNVDAKFTPPDVLPDPRPARMLFGTIKDPRLHVVKPIPLDVSVEESNVVVSWAAVDEFGVGETLSAALDDFASALRELYHSLDGDEQLGPDLENTKRVLAEYIKPR